MQDAATTLRTFASNFEGFHLSLLLICATLGVWLCARSVWKLATWGDRQRAGESPAAGLYDGIAGGALLSLAELVRRVSGTLSGGDDPRSILDYANPTGNEAQMLLTVLLGLMTFYGWISIARGWWLITHLGKEAGGRRPGLDIPVFLITGAIAANFLLFSDVFSATFGWTNYLREILAN